MRNVLITVLGVISVPALVHVLVPGLILQATSHPAPSSIGLIQVSALILAVLGFAMMFWVAVAFVRRGDGTAAPPFPPKYFVATGLFTYVRNPMYLGILLVVLAEAIYFGSGWILLYATVLWMAIQAFLLLIEEPQLEARFGDSYRKYRERTPRWIPRPPRFSGA